MTLSEKISSKISKMNIREEFGEYWISDFSRFIPEEFLKNTDDIVFGVYLNSRTWTVLYQSKLYFSNDSVFSSVTLVEGGDLLHDHYFSKGKECKETYVKVDSGSAIWMPNPSIGSVFQHFMLFIRRSDAGR